MRERFDDIFSKDKDIGIKSVEGEGPKDIGLS